MCTWSTAQSSPRKTPNQLLLKTSDSINEERQAWRNIERLLLADNLPWNQQGVKRCQGPTTASQKSLRLAVFDGELPCTTVQNSEMDTVGYLITFGTSGKQSKQLLPDLSQPAQHGGNGLRPRLERTKKLWAKS